MIEKSRLPRHKVCGEFFSPEIEPELERLGAWDAFRAARPANVLRTVLHFGAKCKSSRLPTPCCSRLNADTTFDVTLLDLARATGAEVVSELGEEPPLIVATGRHATATPRGRRLFGFKAHFEGPVDDAVELFFFERCYVGVTTIEAGRTTSATATRRKVFCHGLVSEYDEIVTMQCPALSGPAQAFAASYAMVFHRAAAIWTSLRARGVRLPGRRRVVIRRSVHGIPGDCWQRSGPGAMAGRAAAVGQPVAQYLRECRASLRQPFQVAGVLRRALEGGWAENLHPWHRRVCCLR